MSRVSLRAWNPVEVEFFGHVFETVDLPDEKSKKLGEVEDKFLQMGDSEDEEKVLAGLWEWFDLLLKPIEGGTKKPSTVLKAKLKSQELTPRQLMALRLDVQFTAAKANAGPESEITCPECGARYLPGAVDRPT